MSLLFLAACSHTKPHAAQHTAICAKITDKLAQGAASNDLTQDERSRLVIQYRGFHCNDYKRATKHHPNTKSHHQW